MGKKNNKMTKMRVEHEDKILLNQIKFPKETDSQLLKRVAKTYRKRGVPNEINMPIRRLIEVTSVYICPELDDALQYLQSILISLSKEPNQEKRVHEARVIGNFLQKRAAGIQKSLEDYEK